MSQHVLIWHFLRLTSHSSVRRQDLLGARPQQKRSFVTWGDGCAGRQGPPTSPFVRGGHEPCPSRVPGPGRECNGLVTTSQREQAAIHHPADVSAGPPGGDCRQTRTAGQARQVTQGNHGQSV